MKKIAVTVFTQAIILGLSLVTGFVLPKFMGPTMFGYWQVYLFYLAYLNLFGLGFNDGISLFYGGFEYKNLPFVRLRSGIRVIIIYLIALTGILFLAVSFVKDSEMRVIYYALALSVPAICLQCIILTVFLSVNRTGIYNVLNFTTKGLSTLFFMFLIFFGITASRPMMYVDLGTRFIITIICIIIAREFIFGKVNIREIGIKEFAQKSKSGINITLALIASSFMPVAGRIVIEWNEPMSIYGMYAFAMSLLSIIIAFTNTAGTVIFPLLKRLKEDLLPGYYRKFSFVCDTLIYVALLAYIPAVLIIEYFMKDFLPVLDYMYILLVMSVPLGKMQLLLISYYKALRLERAFLFVNGAGILLMILSNLAVYGIFHSVLAVAVCTTVVLTIWCTMVERYLIKKMGSKMDLQIFIMQMLMMALFVIAGGFHNLYLFALLYGGGLAIYFVLNHSNIANTLRGLRK